MFSATMQRRIARLREPRRAARLTVALWVVWAVLVWNVVLDHVIVMAGRAYLYAAALADLGRGPQVRMDDFMRPAVTRGLWIASSWAATIAVTGWLGAAVATRRSARP